ncbi:MAG: hypothetical protein KAV87_63005 [Desulfobacteraceae bacterium]|nr:hypothetical protein [Desulfobacteraceae bacterium]
MTIEENRMTLPEAIDLLFGIKLSKNRKIKDCLDNFTREKSGFITVHRDMVVHRDNLTISRDQHTTLFNAVVLQGLFSETRTVRRLLTENNPVFRNQMAELAKIILIDRNTLLGISLLPTETLKFIDVLASDTDLTRVRLKNPFETLPQIVLESGTNTIQAFLAQTAALSASDSMMAHYLAGDIEKAWQAAQQVSSDNETVNKYKALINKEYKEASEFDELLNSLE